MAKGIIPAAGFGTRMNIKVHKSKELLINPKTGKPLIDYVLSHCELMGLDPIVITRPEKKDLIEYLALRNITPLIIEPEGEWANSVLKSQHLWDDTLNILMLPDTVWEGNFTISDMLSSLLMGSELTFAVHGVENISKWGSIDDYKLTEKSKAMRPGYAWGLIGFTRFAGIGLFNAMTKKDTPYQLRDTSFVFLDEFKDLTRTGVITYE